jgi:hypothetical protein
MAEDVLVRGEPITSAGIRGSWKQIVYALEPLTDTLPEPYRDYFKSPVKLLIGKDISLANIPRHHMYSYIQQAEYILSLIYYADIIDINFILREVSKYLNRLGLSMSTDGIFMKYGPMGYQQLTQRYQTVGIPERTRRRGQTSESEYLESLP